MIDTYKPKCGEEYRGILYGHHWTEIRSNRFAKYYKCSICSAEKFVELEATFSPKGAPIRLDPFIYKDSEGNSRLFIINGSQLFELNDVGVFRECRFEGAEK